MNYKSAFKRRGIAWFRNLCSGILAIDHRAFGRNDILLLCDSLEFRRDNIRCGVFVYNGEGIAHFLVEDAEKGKKALMAKGIDVMAINDVLIQKLKQDVPGQLGKICRVMQLNNINILVQYSDHYNQLVLVVDDHEKGLKISKDWSNGVYE